MKRMLCKQSSWFLIKSSFVIVLVCVISACNTTVTTIVDTKKLTELLAQEKWKDADRETDRLMKKNLDCRNIATINSLWVRYSSGKFGFTPQREIWESFPVQKDFTRFGNAVGWRREISSIETVNWARSVNGLTTGSDALKVAPKGHLPFSGWQMDGIIREGFEAFMMKLEVCQI